MTIAEKILAAVRGAPLVTERGAVAVTVSIGAASFCDRGSTSYEVITRAEAALADAKRTGRDCHVHYRSTEDQRERERRHAAIGDAVQEALRQDRVTFAFQPVVSAATGEVHYYECLLRLRAAIAWVGRRTLVPQSWGPVQQLHQDPAGTAARIRADHCGRRDGNHSRLRVLRAIRHNFPG